MGHGQILPIVCLTGDWPLRGGMTEAPGIQDDPDLPAPGPRCGPSGCAAPPAWRGATTRDAGEVGPHPSRADLHHAAGPPPMARQHGPWTIETHRDPFITVRVER